MCWSRQRLDEGHLTILQRGHFSIPTPKGVTIESEGSRISNYGVSESSKHTMKKQLRGREVVSRWVEWLYSTRRFALEQFYNFDVHWRVEFQFAICQDFSIGYGFWERAPITNSFDILIFFSAMVTLYSYPKNIIRGIVGLVDRGSHLPVHGHRCPWLSYRAWATFHSIVNIR